ncbi:MAG TPA: hypothetical protein VF787_15875 [Thermoanaerobaculia bacterium]
MERTSATTSELRDLATYLSTLGVANCDVVILDPSPRAQFDLNARILRWVGRHVAVRSEYRTVNGNVDVIRAAVAYAPGEKVIVAAEDVRYSAEAIGQMCALLEMHEVVEPQDYLDPLPWWGNIEASRMLVHRGIEPQPDHGTTFGFRRAALRSLRGLANSLVYDDPVRRLAASGAEIYAATDVFVRREPGAFRDWLEQRPRLAGEDFAMPVKSAFFFSLVPVLLVLAILGGLQLAGGYASVIAFASVGLAARGRIGATSFFPMSACLFAPLWVFERSLSVYWALYRKVRGTEYATTGFAMPDGARGEKVASGE